MSSAKSSHDDDHLDFMKLEKEVVNAVISDEKYWRENDAKIRAVEQRVPTYDDFREMVLAAHLKPLEKDDRISSIKNFTQVWNQVAEKFPKSTESENLLSNNINQTCQNLPKSGQEFVQHWKRYCKTLIDKKAFIFSVGPKRAEEIFHTEISGGLLGEFVECFLPVEDQDTEMIVGLLEAFSKSQRFSLSMTFLSKKEKEFVKTLFQELSNRQMVLENDILKSKILKLQEIFS
ncbi:coiled-coil domain-containing protein 103-like [Physella acuta]|uniref:coiled-coil domain-containing protein 103-like n=1 Tax=Physella acuta TaxID=109671 RepID=UPI0027DDAC94|nr:coiled-coil domain-containing protein 103-like [Physella acuta]XP_059160967.1 coiled-coil domain-containing protein 103-like [Physella acuta]XP_059160968.1 coiled-coil domain-containing protein 103-like [Physella acuta]XP_059160969.1 coiled-coil domain-containing protein 103-like [Physella acuta]